MYESGDVAGEFHGTMHGWKNNGTQPVDLTIADLVDDKKPGT